LDFSSTYTEDDAEDQTFETSVGSEREEGSGDANSEVDKLFGELETASALSQDARQVAPGSIVMDSPVTVPTGTTLGAPNVGSVQNTTQQVSAKNKKKQKRGGKKIEVSAKLTTSITTINLMNGLAPQVSSVTNSGSVFGLEPEYGAKDVVTKVGLPTSATAEQLVLVVPKYLKGDEISSKAGLVDRMGCTYENYKHNDKDQITLPAPSGFAIPIFIKNDYVVATLKRGKRTFPVLCDKNEAGLLDPKIVITSAPSTVAHNYLFKY